MSGFDSGIGAGVPMEAFKDVILRLINSGDCREAARLAGEFVRAASEEKEAILAEMELEQWVAENCCECLSYCGLNRLSQRKRTSSRQENKGPSRRRKERDWPQERGQG